MKVTFKKDELLLAITKSLGCVSTEKSIVKYMPGDVTIETADENEGGLSTISSGRTKFQLHYISGDAFPQMPELNPDRRFSLPQKMLKKLINQTMFAVAQDETRPALMGLYFEIAEDGVTVVGCDSYQLAVRNAKYGTNITTKGGETEISFLVPGKTVAELARLLDEKACAFQLRHEMRSRGKGSDAFLTSDRRTLY